MEEKFSEFEESDRFESFEKVYNCYPITGSNVIIVWCMQWELKFSFLTSNQTNQWPYK